MEEKTFSKQDNTDTVRIGFSYKIRKRSKQPAEFKRRKWREPMETVKTPKTALGENASGGKKCD